MYSFRGGTCAAKSSIFNINSSYRRLQPQPHAFLARVEHETHHHAVRIDKSIRRTKCATENIVDAKLRHHLQNVLRSNPFDISDPQSILPFAISFQIGKMIFIRRTEQITVRAVIRRVPYNLFKLREEVDRILRHLNVYGSRELRPHTAHALAGRTFALMRLALQHKDVRAPLLSKMISDTRSDNATANDDDVRGFNHR